jgi:hypothetical protein
MHHAHLFAFESDFVATLRCIPMAVRFKLDRVLIKLSLRQWSRFTHDDRQDLLARRCETPAEIADYRQRLVDLVARRAGEAAKPLADPPIDLWTRNLATPAQVSLFAGAVGVRAPSDAQWAALTVLQRFVLVKLTRDNHDNVNFAPALREFGLLARPDVRAAGAHARPSATARARAVPAGWPGP